MQKKCCKIFTEDQNFCSPDNIYVNQSVKTCQSQF